MRRTLLFLPGNAPNMLINGDMLGADSVILDLEDSVDPAQKDAARILVRNVLKRKLYQKSEVIVRINPLGSEFWRADIEAVAPCRPSLLMPAKVGNAEDIREIDEYLTQIETRCGIKEGMIGLLPLLETAEGIENAREIAMSSRRIAGLFLGGEDLTADLHAKRTTRGQEIFYARSRIVCAARSCQLEAYDTPFTDVNDDEGAQLDAQLARDLGFMGKAAISPRHVDMINEVFTPSEAEICYAHQVLRAIGEGRRQGKGAVPLNGKMIDAPIVRRAQQVVEMEHEILGGGLIE
ncbi:MAG: CoA ester lyase [Clostridium sp.]|nr:CoA ester lyase [Clostridium sp.]